MAEPVRLVIWDLDETFWRGTLVEGGITFLPKHKEIVIELARRGIVSSICSKNDFETVKQLLTEHELWEYFVLPSISWEPKGPRTQSLVDTMGLRPPTVLFVDDNPSNLEEVRRFLPSIQVRGHEFIPEMLGNELLRGKEDLSLTRLKQYKVLEQRKADEASAADDLMQFLRDSNIQVRLEFDVEPHLDRVIELINRTNQLNFTKIRLPENRPEARGEALSLLKSYVVQAALVHVTDKYGDHGYCGVYVNNSELRKLLHFCFSCRVLGMGVERWIYQQLGRPKIDVKGEVLTDLFDNSHPIDWINQAVNKSDAAPTEDDGLSFDRIVARGSCDIGAILHYFSVAVANVFGEYNLFRDGLGIRIDHSVFLSHAIHGLSEDQIAMAARLGYVRADFKSQLFSRKSDSLVILLSFGADPYHALYRHRVTGLEVPFSLPGRNPGLDLRQAVESDLSTSWLSAVQLLKDEFDYVGLIQEHQFKDTLALTLNHIPTSARVFIVERAEVGHDEDGTPRRRLGEINRWTREVGEAYKNAQTVSVGPFIRDNSEILHDQHFDRKVYFRIYQAIKEWTRKTPPARATIELIA